MTTTARSRPQAGPRRIAALTVASALLASGMAACTGDEDGPEGSVSSSAPAAPPLATTSTLGVVTGRVGPLQREQALGKVTQAVDGWWDAAYVAGDYPRESFADGFPRFTKGAQEQAVEDVMLMSNADLGQRIDGVTATVRRVTVDLLGTRGIAQGATARVRLEFVTDGGVERAVTVSGRLRLVRQGEVWRVFGYDIAKADKPIASVDESPSETGEAG